MASQRHGRGPYVVGLLVVVAGAGAIAVALSLARFTPRHDAAVDDAAAAPAKAEVVPEPEKEPAPPRPRRIPVGGAPGSFVVLMPDGTSYLEAADGSRQQLVDKTFLEQPSKEEIVERLVSRLRESKRPAARAGPGQLVVLDRGVVEIPKDAQITLVEKDRLVALGDDGSSTVYHADGRTEVRERGQAASKERKDR
jgi:hypothetical protein